MKKKLLIVVLIVVLIISGYFVWSEIKKKRLVNQAQEKAEEYLIENYEEIDTVHIDSENYHFKPMGTLGIGGHINNEDKLTFYITFLIEDKEVGEMQTIVKAPDFPNRKDENKEDQ